MKYNITYTRLDTKTTYSKQVSAHTMREAVKVILEYYVNKYGVKITDISVKIAKEEKGGVQLFCTKCNEKPASQTIKNKWFCSGCFSSQKHLT